ncbi:CQS_1a_G0057040.mRNA.1.CDS.1 [Saccharomyces cerevisiae]|nr:CQS_1a_G0057040.mRNA.1.CDS.1 [Saccharomyces cerevisiae]CAI7489029.1 CQS_1a_G0057040.mRNA.1.CDS.1 [Saccharomyces cerevisiae]
MLSAARLQFAQGSVRRLTVSARDAPTKISTLAVKVHGGSRYATKDGVAHLLNRFNFQNTNTRSALKLVRESELLGGTFKSTLDREYITLKATFLKDDLPYYVNALADALYKTAFKPHELTESVLPAARYDYAVAEQCPVKSAEDQLYAITFRKGLGNPLLYDGVERVNLQDIKDFADKVYTKENLEVSGENVVEADLKRFVDESLLSTLPAGKSLVSKSELKSFLGEENRVRFIGDSVAAIGIPVNKASLAQYEVLANYLTSALSNLSGLISSAKLDKFTDGGLFTLFVRDQDSAVVSSNIKKIVADLKKGKDLSPAINYTKLKNAIQNESVSSPIELNFDAVKDFKLGKFNYVAVGDVSNLPYLDEL